MSIFDTTAPTSSNAFGAPTNIWGSGSGGWGINPNYLTPSYTAPYRPPYTGGQSSPSNPGFFKSVYGVSPLNFRGSQYGVGTSNDESNYWDSIHNRSSDFGMAGAQRFGVPLLAYGGAMAFARNWQVSVPGGATGGALRGWNAMWGRPAEATISGFTGMGARAMGGAAQTMITGMFGAGAMSGTGFGAMAARGAVGAAGGMGAILGGVGIPLLLAQGAISAFDNLVSDNYIGMRENSNVMRSAFRGVSFGGGMGDRFTGAGLSRASSARMGTEMAQFGSRDQVFNSREMASMTSMSAQMGLLDNVSGDQLTQRMKSIINQVKAVMSVAGTTEFKEAVQIMARLQMAGVAAPSLASTFSGLGNLSSQAGIGVGRMMNTVGAQGQYLFQANGLTPYVGQITAANSMAGFSSAFRSGLVAPDLMARMGGVEGATQSSLTGQLNAAQTTYNMMRGFNRYTSGTGGQGVVQNIANFGSTFAGNPLAAYGALMRTGRANISRQMRDEGPLAIYNQAREIANLNPIVGNRKMNQDELFATLMPMMGNDPRQVEAYMAELSSYQDPKTMALRAAGMRTGRINAQKDYLSQTEQTWAMTLPGVQSAVGIYRGVSSDVTGMLGAVYGTSGSLVDRISAYAQGVQYGSADSLAGGSARELANREIIHGASGIGRNVIRHGGDIRKLQHAADSGDAVARRALRGDKDAIQEKADAGLIDKSYADGNLAAQMAATLQSLPRAEGGQLGVRAGAMSEDLRGGVFGARTASSTIGGGPSSFSESTALQGYRLAWKMQQELDKNPDALRDGSMGGLMKEAGKMFGDLGPRDMKKRIEQALGEASDFGVDVSRDYGNQRAGESFADYAKRVDLRFDPRTKDKSINASLADKIKGLRGRMEVNTQERQMNQTREALMGMGRIDLVAAYDMTNAAGKWDQVADKWDAVANKILGTEVTTGQPGKPSLSNPTSGSLLDRFYRSGNRIHGSNN